MKLYKGEEDNATVVVLETKGFHFVLSAKDVVGFLAFVVVWFFGGIAIDSVLLPLTAWQAFAGGVLYIVARIACMEAERAIQRRNDAKAARDYFRAKWDEQWRGPE